MKLRNGLALLCFLTGASMLAAPQTPKTAAPRDPERIDAQGYQKLVQQYHGKPLLVNFWATWCEPCKSEIPMLIDLQQKYGSRGFSVLGLSMDEDGMKAVQPFLDKERFDVGGQKEAINYPIVFANDSIAEKFGGILGLPTSLLFTRDGKGVKKIVGPIDYADMAKAIEGLL